MQGPIWGWAKAQVWAPLGVGFLLLIAFAVVELRATEPLIEVDLFSNRAFTSGILILFFAQYS